MCIVPFQEIGFITINVQITEYCTDNETFLLSRPGPSEVLWRALLPNVIFEYTVVVFPISIFNQATGSKFEIKNYSKCKLS